MHFRDWAGVSIKWIMTCRFDTTVQTECAMLYINSESSSNTWKLKFRQRKGGLGG